MMLPAPTQSPKRSLVTATKRIRQRDDLSRRGPAIPEAAIAYSDRSDRRRPSERRCNRRSSSGLA